MDLKWSEACHKLGTGGKVGSCCASLIVFIALILAFPATIKQLGTNKIGLAKNKVSGVVDFSRTFTPGRYWLGFWREFIEFPSTIKAIDFTSNQAAGTGTIVPVLRTRDRDGKQVYLHMSIEYQLKPLQIGQLYAQLTLTYEPVYVTSLRDAMYKVANAFSVRETWEDYDLVYQKFLTACQAALDPLFANCWDVQLWGIELDSVYENTLTQTQVSKQTQKTEQARLLEADVRAKTQVALALYTSNITIINQTGLSQVYEITRAATVNAQASIIRVQAEVLNVIRDTLVVNATAQKMNSVQLVEYQKNLMLQDQPLAQFVYAANGNSLQAYDVQAVKQILEL